MTLSKKRVMTSDEPNIVEFNALNADLRAEKAAMQAARASLLQVTAEALAGISQGTEQALGLAAISPNYIFAESETPSAAPDGTQAAWFKSNGLLQRLKRIGGAWVDMGSPIITLLGAQLRAPDIRVDDYITDWNANHNAAFSAAQDAALARGIDPGTPSIQLTPGRMYRLHEWGWNPRVSLISGAGRLASARLLYDGAGGTGSSIIKPISGSSYGKFVGVEFVGANFPWSGVVTVVEPDFLIDFGSYGIDQGFNIPSCQLVGGNKGGIRFGPWTNVYLTDFRTDQIRGPVIDATANGNMESRPLVIEQFTVDTYKRDGSQYSGGGLLVVRGGAHGARIRVSKARYEANLPPDPNTDGNPLGALISIVDDQNNSNFRIEVDNLTGYLNRKQNYSQKHPRPVVACSGVENSGTILLHNVSLNEVSCLVSKQDGTPILRRNGHVSNAGIILTGTYNETNPGLGDKRTAFMPDIPANNDQGRWKSGDTIDINPVKTDGSYKAVCTSPSGGFYSHWNTTRAAFPFVATAGSAVIATASAAYFVMGDMIEVPGAGAAGVSLLAKVIAVDYPNLTITLDIPAVTSVAAGANLLYQVPTWKYLKTDSAAANMVTTDTPQNINALKTIYGGMLFRSALDMRFNPVRLGTENDAGHALRYCGTGYEFNAIAIDGPVLHGFAGGALGTKQGATERLSFQWSTNRIAFFGGALALKTAVTGVRGTSAAQASLLSALAGYGLLTDSTTTPLTATAPLDFPSIAAHTTAELPVTLTGAVVGDAVALGAPATLEAGLMVSARVTAANTVTVRCLNGTAAAIDPASASYTVAVVR